MSDDPNEKELPEDEEKSSDGEESGASTGESEATEVEVEPVGSDEGPGDSPTDSEEGSPSLLGQGEMSEKDDKTFGMLVHLLGAFTSFVGPLVIWMIKKEESPFVDDQGKEALNFQITVMIGFVGLMVIPFAGCLSPAIWIAGIVFSILGCLKANEGIAYRYPFALRLIK